jgi:hypothetical protein
MKKRIWLVLLVLSITPFARSCDVTVGFPLPLAPDFSGSNELPYSKNLQEWLIQSIPFLLTNILILSLIALSIIKREKIISWLWSAYHALLVNIWINWSGYLIYIFWDTSGRKNPVILSFLYDFSYMFHYTIPSKVSYWITKNSYGNGLVDDILFRAWFILTTVLTTLLFYWTKKVRDRYIKKRATL